MCLFWTSLQFRCWLIGYFVYLSALEVAHMSDIPRSCYQGIVEGYRTKLLRIPPGSLMGSVYSTVTWDLGLKSLPKDC